MNNILEVIEEKNCKNMKYVLPAIRQATLEQI